MRSIPRVVAKLKPKAAVRGSRHKGQLWVQEAIDPMVDRLAMLVRLSGKHDHVYQHLSVDHLSTCTDQRKYQRGAIVPARA